MRDKRTPKDVCGEAFLTPFVQDCLKCILPLNTEEIALFMKTTPLLNHSIFASDEHLFYNCEIKRSFWVALRYWIMECNIN